jgi:serine phosphatase RsbU (regulator of sigma subunit)
MRSPGKGTPLPPNRELRYLEFLVRVGEILSSAIDWERTVNSVCHAAVETVADICVLGLTDPALHIAGAAHRNPEMNAQLQGIGAVLFGPRSTTHPIVKVIRKKKPILVPEITDEWFRLHSTSREDEAFMRRMGYKSLMVVPLVSASQGVIGALQFVRTDAQVDEYDELSLRFAEDVARHCANAIDKSRLYEQTLRIATLYQKAALPDRLPQCEGIFFDAIYEPSSQELLVGGDWYDAFNLVDGKIAITVGDVLGHGLDAAIWMSRLRNGLRAALFADDDPVRALEIAGRLLRAEIREEFVTAIVGVLDPVAKTLECASAGHPGPLIWHGGDEVVDPITDRGVPLGLSQLGPGAKKEKFALKPGCFLVFFTDGLLEWNRNINEAWTQLQNALRRAEVRESAHPALAIRDAVIGANRHGDDVAVLTIHMEERKAYDEVRTLSESVLKGKSISAVPTISAAMQASNEDA